MNETTLNGDMNRGERIYFDVCALGRPYDDQGQQRIRLESEAVKTALFLVEAGEVVAINSEVIRFEISRMIDVERHIELSAVVNGFREYVQAEDAEIRRGELLESLGFKAMDALHVACAEKAHADVLLTTDDGLLKKAIKHASSHTVRVMNPLAWIEEVWDR
jgi:predicted nucleic acid-binding protein